MFNRHDLIFPQQEIIVTRNTNRDSWVGQCEVFNRNPSECVGVMVRQLDRNYHYNYRLLEGSSYLLQPSGSVNDFHSFKFMVVFNDDKGGPVGDSDKVMKGADREEIERMVEKGHSMLLEDLCVVYGNVIGSTDWKARLEKFAPYRAGIRVRIPSLPFNKRRTILIPEVGTQNHRVNDSNDILQEAAVSHQEELDQGYQQIRKVLRIKKFTDFEIRAQKLFRNFTNPSEPYKAEHAEVFPNRYIQFKRETRIQLKKGKRSYNPWIGEVTIRNHAPSHYLIYKLRTTAPQHYVVMPTEGVLMPRFRRKMFSLKYQTSKFTETLEHLNKNANATSNNSQGIRNASAGYSEDVMSETTSNKQEQLVPDVMMDKKFERSSITRNAPQNKVRCENHRFADTQNFASLARDTLNEKEHEEQADSVSIRFLYSDVIAEGEALSSRESAFAKAARKKGQQLQQQHMYQQQQQHNFQRDDRPRSSMPQRRTSRHPPESVLLNHSSHAGRNAHNNSRNTNAYQTDGMAGYNYRSSSTSDLTAGLKHSTYDGPYERIDGNVFQMDTVSMDTSKSSAELNKFLSGSGREEDGGPQKVKTQKRKDQATWMKMASTERSAEVKDEKNHVQSHVFLLDVAFVDPYAVDERNYNIEELFRHTETLTGGYKMSRCFYPYFVPEDTISGPVIVYPKNDVVIDRGVGSPHVHWLTEIYLVNIYKSTLFYCIIPQEEDYGQLELGDEILVTPRSGRLLHYSEKRRYSLDESNMSDSLCEQIQIYLRYTRTCFMEDGPIFKLHIFFFTESAAPDWLKNAEAEKLDVSSPTYCNPLSRALDVVTVRIFIKDAEQQVAAKNTLNYDDLDDTEDVFRSFKGENGQWCDAAKDAEALSAAAVAAAAAAASPYSRRFGGRRVADLMHIQDAAGRVGGALGLGELLHQAGVERSAVAVHASRDPVLDPLLELAHDCDTLSVTSMGYAANMMEPASILRVAGVQPRQLRQEQEEQEEEQQEEQQEEEQRTSDTG